MNMRSTLSKSTRINHHQYINSNELIFTCLNGKDVIDSQVSDHHPTIHHNTLFWNIMMQGRMRKDGNKISYNNGFALIESDREYHLLASYYQTQLLKRRVNDKMTQKARDERYDLVLHHRN